MELEVQERCSHGASFKKSSSPTVWISLQHSTTFSGSAKKQSSPFPLSVLPESPQWLRETLSHPFLLVPEIVTDTDKNWLRTTVGLFQVPKPSIQVPKTMEKRQMMKQKTAEGWMQTFPPGASGSAHRTSGSSHLSVLALFLTLFFAQNSPFEGDVWNYSRKYPSWGGRSFTRVGLSAFGGKLRFPALPLASPHPFCLPGLLE